MVDVHTESLVVFDIWKYWLECCAICWTKYDKSCLARCGNLFAQNYDKSASHVVWDFDKWHMLLGTLCNFKKYENIDWHIVCKYVLTE